MVISHNHYDHLDHSSVMQLHERFGDEKNNLQWFVGAGLKSWFNSCGIKTNVHELQWWESRKYKNMEFVFTIAQHWSSRGLHDRNKVSRP